MATFDATGRLGPVREQIARFIADGEVDGAALAVAVGGEQVAEWYGGEAAPGRAAGPETLWPLGSIAKSYTAAAVLALVERGTLTLGTPVRAILSAFDGDGRERVQLRHLLTHTSGLVYESPEMERRLLARTPLDALVDEAYTYPLQFPPGARFSYSDYGYALAGRMAAVAAGRPFPALVHALVLDPADLRETFMPPPPEEQARLAHVVGTLAYGTDGAMYNSPYALALAHPAFGAVAGVADLLRFGLLFDPRGRRRIVAEATVRAMTTDQTGGHADGGIVAGEPAAPQPWGLGFSVHGPGGRAGYGDLAPPGSFGHGGATGCVLLVAPADGIALAYVSNRHVLADPARFAFRLSAVVNGVLAALTRRGA
ncbi:MAG TPA: serine hydrolase domain-containing protein [Thermomicrobiales bacterium]|nr:serine hydrolase domain-containing protein [Thermomicrobiales bacterium]